MSDLAELFEFARKHVLTLKTEEQRDSFMEILRFLDSSRYDGLVSFCQGQEDVGRSEST